MPVQLRRSSYLSQEDLIQLISESFCHGSELEVKGNAVCPGRGAKMLLIPSMAVTAELSIVKRGKIEFVLAPL
jgi:hypothetical protein